MGMFTMPSLGADMEDGILVEWLKHAGDSVARGDIIAVVETEKGAIEIEIFEDGTIETILVEEGRKVPVGTPLAKIAGVGEPAVADVAETEEIVEQPRPVPAKEAPAPPPTAPTAPVEWQGIRASPAARKLAAERKIDLASISGSGPGGAVQLKDVEAAGEQPARRAIDIDAMRHAIAAAMSRSKREIPHYYLTSRVDITPAQDWLASYNANRSPPERLLFGALLVKATAIAARDFPEFNGTYEDDSHKPESAVHAGIAIAIRGGGLVAPAIRNTDQLTLPELMVQMRDLIGRVRRGRFTASELTSSTITVNSLGDRGAEGVLPIIYPPQVSIVGFGKPVDQPWVVDGEVLPRPVMQMTLAADHRVSDGHRGGLFLNAIAERLDDPEAL